MESGILKSCNPEIVESVDLEFGIQSFLLKQNMYLTNILNFNYILANALGDQTSQKISYLPRLDQSF